MADPPSVTREEIAGALAEAGVAADDVLLAHSSLSSFGYVDGGADSVIDALLDAVGASGTVLVPTHTWDSVNRENPVFDVRATPSCVGVISNAFRRREGALRSLHPTHSCAGIGPAAAEVLGGHEKDITPCGDSSPYARICRRGGKLAFLGTGLGCNTTLHAIEEAASLEYLFDEFHDLYTIDYDASRLHVPQRRHSEGFGRCFAEVGELFGRRGIIRRASAGAATIEVVEADAMWGLLLPMVAEDPFCLLRKDAAELLKKWLHSRPRPRRLG